MSSETAERRRLANQRRQREYRARQKSYKSDLQRTAFRADVLEDAIKLSANKGDELAAVIMAAVPAPTVEHLAAWFRQRAEAKHPARSASRNKKKNTQADDGAGVFL
jgi:hypothetical protein